MRSSSEEKLLCLTEQIDIFVLLYQSIQNCLSLRKPSLTIVFKPSINLKINKLIYLHMHLHLFISKKKYFRQIWFRALMFILQNTKKCCVQKQPFLYTRPMLVSIQKVLQYCMQVSAHRVRFDGKLIKRI